MVSSHLHHIVEHVFINEARQKPTWQEAGDREYVAQDNTRCSDLTSRGRCGATQKGPAGLETLCVCVSQTDRLPGGRGSHTGHSLVLLFLSLSLSGFTFSFTKHLLLLVLSLVWMTVVGVYKHNLLFKVRLGVINRVRRQLPPAPPRLRPSHKPVAPRTLVPMYLQAGTSQTLSSRDAARILRRIKCCWFLTRVSSSVGLFPGWCGQLLIHHMKVFMLLLVERCHSWMRLGPVWVAHEPVGHLPGTHTVPGGIPEVFL